MSQEIIFDTFYELQESLFTIAREKEERYNNYYHNMTITNRATQSSYNMDYSNYQYFSDFGNIALQKVLYNKVVAKSSDLVSTFFTITLPSKYHYFITTQKIYNHQSKKYETKPLEFEDWRVNHKYGFNSMEEGIQEGYQALSLFWRTFYNKIKTGSRRYKQLAKNMRYDLISEFHKTLQIHTHGILYSHPDLLPYIQECFADTIKELGFNKQGCDIKQNFNNNDGATQYILKYTTKFLNSDANKEEHFYEMEFKSHADFMVGWKSLLGKYSRIHKSSNTKLGIGIYKKIYHNMSKEQKDILLAHAIENNTCLLYEIEQQTYKHTTITNKETGEIKTNTLNEELKEPMFKVVVKKDKEHIDKSELLKNLYHQKSIYEQRDTPTQILIELQERIEKINNSNNIYTYSLTHLVIQNTNDSEIYNKEWFSSYFNEDLEYEEEDMERISQFL